ncbi:MAG: hypothetical protein KDC18_10235 [Alphaproteobacteria bacterium]|nr:hypothetical protein [Alphaproteobacteria bacterium]MCB9928303.1 hypothetical protein [Alphaproteobacteria bacterium]
MPSVAPSVASAIMAIPELVRADAALMHRFRHFTGQLSVSAGETRWFLPFVAGEPAGAVAATTILTPAAVAFNAAPAVWLAHWQPVPTPPHHDLFGLVKARALRIDGDMTVFMQQLQNIKDVLAKPRALFA